jgi:Fur family iron response transcriptional regulator
VQTLTARDLQQRLRGAGVLPTLQRMAVASVMLARPVHLTAEQVLDRARQTLPEISRATVYAVLRHFVRQGLLKELPIEGASTVYDSNLSPHHHLYDVDTGAVVDLPAEALQVAGVAQAVQGLSLAGVDVILRVRGLGAAPRA